jgi:hypothetical protein
MTARSCLGALWVTAVLATGASPTSAQQLSTSAIDSARAEALAKLSPGTRVRVRTTGQTVYEGELQSATADELSLRTTSGQISLSATQVSAVAIHSRPTERSALMGSLVGAVTVGLFGGRFGAAACDAPDGRGCDGVIVMGFGAGAVLGTVSGALVGMVVGSFLPNSWRPHWAAPPVAP